VLLWVDDLVFRVEVLRLLVDDGPEVSSVLEDVPSGGEVDNAKLVMSVVEDAPGVAGVDDGPTVSHVDDTIPVVSAVLEDAATLGKVDDPLAVVPGVGLLLTDVKESMLEGPTGTLLNSEMLVALGVPTGGGLYPLCEVDCRLAVVSNGLLDVAVALISEKVTEAEIVEGKERPVYEFPDPELVKFVSMGPVAVDEGIEAGAVPLPHVDCSTVVLFPYGAVSEDG
jgi:hypothetical protein